MLVGKKVIRAYSIAYVSPKHASMRRANTNSADDQLIKQSSIATALTEDDKLELEQDMTALRIFAEKKCIGAQSPLDYTLQVSIQSFSGPPSARKQEGLW